MDTPNPGAGERDLVATLTEASLPLPPLPAELAWDLERRDAWFWSTRDLDRSQLYDPELLIREATHPVPDYLALAHVGHGMNSYFLTYQLVSGPLALFAQVAWGGALTVEEAEVKQVRLTFEAIASLLAAAHSRRPVRHDLRLVVMDGATKGIDTCTWVALDGQPRPELERWPRAAGATNALLRGVSELSSVGGGGP